MFKINAGMLATVAILICLYPAAPSIGQETSSLLQREQIDDRYKWDLSHIYPDWSAWEAGLKDLEQMADSFITLKGTLVNGPESLYKAYKLFDDLGIVLHKVSRLPYLYQTLDNTNNEYSARLQQVYILWARFNTSTSWFYPELLALPRGMITNWLDSTRILDPYRFNIEDAYRSREHVLEEPMEKLLSYFNPLINTSVEIYKKLAMSDIKFNSLTLSSGETVTVTPGRYSSIVAGNLNQEDRARAFEAYYAAYYPNRNSYAAIYNSVLQRDWALAQARRYESTLEASLDADNVPVAVVDYLIAAVSNGLEPLQRYHRIRKQKLGLESYHVYDRRISIINFLKEYEYDEATGFVYESVAPLGREYQKTVREAIDNRWIDAFETKGKTIGAFSSDVYGVHPYLMLNYNKTLTSVYTLAHEMGHCMHSHLANTHQPKATANVSTLTTEVASQIGEFFLLDYLLEKSGNTDERVALLIRAIDDLEGTFYAQALNAAFELQAHRLVEQGMPITAETLTEIYAGLVKEQAGDVIAADTLTSLSWCRIPHFYESPYYIYQYAAGFAAAEKLYVDIQSPDKKVRQEAIDRYLDMLKAGGSDYPMELLRKAGVDMLNPDTYTYVVKKMDKLVTQLEKEIAGR